MIKIELQIIKPLRLANLNDAYNCRLCRAVNQIFHFCTGEFETLEQFVNEALNDNSEYYELFRFFAFKNQIYIFQLKNDMLKEKLSPHHFCIRFKDDLNFKILITNNLQNEKNNTI